MEGLRAYLASIAPAIRMKLPARRLCAAATALRTPNTLTVEFNLKYFCPN
jgi:hypothetical protein